jgi:hypothetical protein
MQENKCIICFGISSEFSRVNDEIKFRYHEITAMTVSSEISAELTNARFLISSLFHFQFEAEDEEIAICRKCKELLEKCCSFKQLIVNNRTRLTEYLEERKLQQLQKVQIKVEEVSAEDYQITEYCETPVSDDRSSEFMSCEMLKLSFPATSLAQVAADTTERSFS